MATKTIKTRIQNKHDIEANWNDASFAPYAGELIIYDPDNTHLYPRFKIGDGTTLIGDLPFCLDGIYSLDSSITVFGCTNQIRTSTDASGQVYNGIGYKNGIRWSSSGGGEVVADNMGMSGFIPVKPNDVLRLKNVSIVTNSYVVYFDANKQVLATDTSFGSTDSAGVYVKTLTNSNAAFIRLATGTIDKTTVATINEEIGASGEYKTGWLINNRDEQFAPNTFISSIFDENGELYSSVINNKFAQAESAVNLLTTEIADKANQVHSHTPDQLDTSKMPIGEELLGSTLEDVLLSIEEALAKRVIGISGKGLSTNDFTNADKSKLNSSTSVQLVSWEDSDF